MIQRPPWRVETDACDRASVLVIGEMGRHLRAGCEGEELHFAIIRAWTQEVLDLGYRKSGSRNGALTACQETELRAYIEIRDDIR